MADRSLRRGWIWILFLGVTFTGAGLLFTADPSDDALGLALIAAPAVVLGAMMGLYYWKTRQIT